jgi:low affinity Fe/Cu permease
MAVEPRTGRRDAGPARPVGSDRGPLGLASAASEPPTSAHWRDRFNQWADRATAALGSATAILLSLLMVVVWALVGPLFGFSDSWQLVINTATTVITFWMVFVIQNSQNRDARALHLKLDEIIRATENARNEFIVAEKSTEAELEAHETELQELGDRVEAAHPVDVEAAPAGGEGSRPGANAADR